MQARAERERACEAQAGLDAISTVRRRRPPRLAIVNADAQVVLISGGPSDCTRAEFEFPTDLVAKLIVEIEQGTGEAYALISATAVLRASPLATGSAGESGRRYALFVEHIEARDLLNNASERFGLSAREIDILRLILHGLSTAEIADRLCIANTTVHAHVKNIARKTNSNKRTEILAKLMGVR